jgi:hypothetical protein
MTDNNNSDPMSEEQNEIAAEGEQLKQELTDFGRELEAFRTDVAGPLQSYKAIGLSGLKPADRTEVERLAKVAATKRKALEARAADLRRRSDVHVKRQNARIDALKKERDAKLKERDFLQAELDQLMTREVNKVAGLLSYATATGALGAEWSFALSVCRDFRESTTHENRSGNFALLTKILGSVQVPSKDETGADDGILTQFESISDPEERSSFYNKHHDEIQRGFDARKNNLS